MRIKRALAGTMAALMAMTLVACGGGGAEGEWVVDKGEMKKMLEKVIDDGAKEALEAGAPEEMVKAGVDKAKEEIPKQIDKADFVLTLKGDGTVSFTGKVLESEGTKKDFGATWKQDGSSVVFSGGGSDGKTDIKGEIKGGKLYIDPADKDAPEGVRLVLKRK